MLDRNPTFGQDSRFQSDALRVTDMLWQATKGNLASIPREYLSSLNHEYSDGRVSMLGHLNKVTFSGAPTYETYSEVVNRLLYVEASEWPFSESIMEIQAEKLLSEGEDPEFSETFEFSSPRGMSDKMEMFLKKVIASVYTDGVTEVTDMEGNPPNLQNRYLLSDDGKSFSGIFYDKSDPSNEKEFPFEIRETPGGSYEISY